MGYEKPIVLETEELAEGVFAASGSSSGGNQCDSIYMKGEWQKPDYSNWDGGKRGYKKQFGCLGCPAYTDTGCGLLTHYPGSGYASSYDVDKGNRKPSWERKGHKPDDSVIDWNCKN